MAHRALVERNGVSGKVIRVFIFDIDGVTEREGDYYGKIKKRFVYQKDKNAIFEYHGERDERVKRILTFHEGHVTLGEGGKYGKIKATYLIDPSKTKITERIGGKYGHVIRTFIIDSQGILEKEGEEYRDRRMFIFEKDGATIKVREGGWFGKITQLFLGEGVSPTTFRDPEGFLQFLFYID